MEGQQNEALLEFMTMISQSMARVRWQNGIGKKKRTRDLLRFNARDMLDKGMDAKGLGKRSG